MDERYKSRKFRIAVYFSIISTIALFTHYIEGGVFASLVGLILGLYGSIHEGCIIMAGICFYYENANIDVCSGKNLFAWDYACIAAGDIDKIIVINLSDSVPMTPGELTGQDYDFKIVQSITEAEALMAGDRITQVVCPWNFEQVTDLWDYNHQTDWYVFGPSTGWNGHDMHTNKITIPQVGKTGLWSVHAATVILTHRYGTRNTKANSTPQNTV